jgi:hypothetical protein
MVIELKNKYSSVIELRAAECEAEESVTKHFEFPSFQKVNLNVKKSRTARKDTYLLDNYMT